MGGTYRIDLPGVQKALTSTQTEAREFETILQPLSGAVGDAAGGTGMSPAIVPALNEFFTAQNTRVQGMATRIGACLEGAAQATNAYKKGDVEMAETYQSNAVKAAGKAPR